MYCMYCDRDQVSDAVFCFSCGAELLDPKRIAEEWHAKFSPHDWETVWEIVDHEVSKLPPPLPNQSYAKWLGERIDNPIESTENQLHISHTFPAWSDIHDQSVQYSDGWAINAEELHMLRFRLDEDGMLTVDGDNIPKPSSLSFTLKGMQNFEAFTRAMMLGNTARFLVDQYYPDGTASPEVAGNKHHKTTRLASAIANIVREINTNTEVSRGQGSTVFPIPEIYETLVLERIPPGDVTFFAKHY